ncbi:UxaA family hydrolase [Vulcanisaeta thermophila]|uniref:UxaA family hydrolase n=1 Tax=Vulcanisaeta thermophila TaxID=867917 RepID=UPI000852961D|nr:UxaA family hydrolase [Vulcanisaeta thermophila]
MPRALKINAKDNVAVALDDVRVGDLVEVVGQEVRVFVKALNSVPRGHKIALVDIPRGGFVIKYGEVIGVATRDIRAGEHVHVHNLDSVRGKAP